MKYIALIIATLITITGCASLPKTPEERVSYALQEANDEFSKGNDSNAASRINLAIDQNTSLDKIKDFFNKNKKASSIYSSYLQKEISQIDSVNAAQTTTSRVITAIKANLFSEAQNIELMEKLNIEVENGNISGKIRFDLEDDTSIFPRLKTSAHQEAMLDRSIDILQSYGAQLRPKLLVAVLNIASNEGKNSSSWKKVESALPAMKIRKEDLTVVAKIFPDFANQRLQQSTVRVFMEMKNGDRLLKDDLQSIFNKRMRGIEWVKSPELGATIITIEKFGTMKKQYQKKQKQLPMPSIKSTYLVQHS